MKICWLETRRGNNRGVRKCDPNQEVSAGLRYANRLSKIFDADLLTDAHSVKQKSGIEYDAIISGYSTAYQEFKIEAEFIKSQKKARLYHISTEYSNALPASLYYAKKPFTHIANYEKIPIEQTKGGWSLRSRFEFLNLNCVHYVDSITSNSKVGAIYFGRYRADRVKYLRLLNGSGVVLSTTKDNVAEYKMNGIDDVRYIEKIDWTLGRETLRLFLYSIYFEDAYTHKNFNNLANRWYESMSFNTQPIVHVSCLGTLERSGINIDKLFLFESNEELKKIIENDAVYKKLIEWRRIEKDRIKNEKKELSINLKKVLSC